MKELTISYSERLAPLTDIETEAATRLGARFDVVPMWTHGEIAEHAAAAAVVVGAVEPLDQKALQSLHACQLVVRRGIGLNNIDVDAATQLGIPVAYVPNASVHEVSEHALALLLALERRVTRLDAFVRSGNWSKNTVEIAKTRAGMRRLSDLTLGVVGLGRIGSAFAAKARHVVGRTLGFDPVATSHSDVELVSLSTVLTQSDIISIHAPLTAETLHMFDAAAFSQIKHGCTLINTSRGALIDSAALVAALEAGVVSGAGLDVTEIEPIEPTSEFLRFDNVILTGHSASSSVASAREARQIVSDALVDGLQGRHPAFVANPEVFEAANCRIQ